MKHVFIQLNDLFMILFVVVLMVIGHHLVPLFGAVLGLIVGAVIGGFWFVLSGIYENGRATIVQQKALNRHLEKLNSVRIPAGIEREQVGAAEPYISKGGAT